MNAAFCPILIAVFFCSPYFSNGQPLFEISNNVYRVPYANGTNVVITRDHFSHSPEQGRYDMHADGIFSSCGSSYSIVAAAAGVVRRIVDHHSMHGPDCTGDNCADYNNYVWIEHANGEWSKYSHMKQFSTTANAGLEVGDCVTSGQFLGYECEIGNASGPHLHFEVRRPNNPSGVQISTAGGFMSDAAHLIPAVCAISRNFFKDGDDITSASCSNCSATDNYLLTNLSFVPNQVYVKIAGGTITTSTNVNFVNSTSTMLKANGSVTLLPGLTIQSGAYFHAWTGSCNTTPFIGSCN